jgi:uncharacterized protein
MAGYKNQKEFYDAVNPMRTVGKIKNPCLFINSEDDPLCVLENVTDNMTSIESSDACIVAVTKTGSHLPFYEGLFMRNWAERCTYEFFDVVMKNKSKRVAVDLIKGIVSS